MKGVVISSNASGGGKTTVTLGLMKALRNRGFTVQGYKVGPDYIDPAFHSHITSRASRNLDLYLMGEDGVKASISRGKAELAVIEGVMGLYDGKGVTSEYSTAHTARVLHSPVILVLSPKAQCATLCAEILGLKNFEDVNIAGIIFNNVSESYYNLLKIAVEVNCGIKVFGYLPKDERLSLKSRHLGLVQSSEIKDLDEKIQVCAELLEQHVDMEGIIEVFKDLDSYEDKFHIRNRDIKIAVAYDKAFSFYYKENLELLEEAGEVTYFSPLKDKAIPEGTDFLYLGGGYPEVFINELSENKSMLKSIRDALSNGLVCYAECGGLMYLTKHIDEVETVGFFNGSSYMTGKLQNFGYAEITVDRDNNLLPVGMKIKCHEFHKSCVKLEEDRIYSLKKIKYDNSISEWSCGYIKNNTLGAYGHVHFFNNLEMLKSMLQVCRRAGSKSGRLY